MERKEKVKTAVSGQKVVIMCDEITDMHCIVEGGVKMLDQANATECLTAVMEVIQEYGISYNSARYMTLCAEMCSELCPTMVHVQCWAHKLNIVVVLSNGWLWRYAISLLASQYSCAMFFFLSGLSTGHCGRWASFIMESSCWHMMQLAEGRILILCRWAARQSWPVANLKVARASLLGLFLFWSHNSLIPFHFFTLLFVVCVPKIYFVHQ